MLGKSSNRWSKPAAHLFTLAFLLGWWVYGQFVEAYLMPGPLEVASRLGEFLTDPKLLVHMLVSFGHILGAVTLSFLLGFSLALLPYYLPVFHLLVHGRLCPFLNSFSGIGWTLLAVVWFGINHLTVIFAISMVLIPFAIVNIREGLATLDDELLEMSHSFGRQRWPQFCKIILPSLYPFIFATLRVSFGVAWKVALTAELFGGSSGLGYLFNLARQDFDTPLILVVIVIIVAFVYCTERFVFAPIQDRLARQRQIS